MCVCVYVGQRYRGYFTKYPYFDQSARKYYHGRTFGAIDLDKHNIHKTEVMSLVHLLRIWSVVTSLLHAAWQYV